jgi:hypothetical protein
VLDGVEPASALLQVTMMSIREGSALRRTTGETPAIHNVPPCVTIRRHERHIRKPAVHQW